MRFSYIDFFLYGAIVIAAYLGYKGGITKKIFNLLALLASIVIAVQLMEPIGDALISSGIFSAPLAYIVGFALVNTGLMVLAIMLYRRFGKTSVGKSSSQLIGLILGVLEGCLVVSLLLLALKVFDFPSQSTRYDSMLYKPLVNFTPKTLDLLQSYLPGASSFRDELTSKFQQYNIFDLASPPGKKP